MSVNDEVSGEDVQAEIEGIKLEETVEFMGQQFRLPEKIGIMPLLIFANAAKRGLSSDDMEGAAALYAMIRDCINPEDWSRFEQLAIDTRAGGDDLFPVVERVMEIIAARPTQRPSGSSSPASKRSKKSRANSRSKLADEDLTPVGDIAR